MVIILYRMGLGVLPYTFVRLCHWDEDLAGNRHLDTRLSGCESEARVV